MTMQEHNIIMGMFMDSSSSNPSTHDISSSSSSLSTMHPMAPISTMTGPFPTLEHTLNYMSTEGLYFNVQPCIAQARINDTSCNVYNQNNMTFGGDHTVSMEGDLFNFPPLESTNITEDSSKIENLVEIRSSSNKNIVHNMNNTVNQCDSNLNNIKVENEEGFGGYWEGEELRVGEWDLEELMKDVPASFPLLDFQVE